jgi:hypothetical protein
LEFACGLKGAKIKSLVKFIVLKEHAFSCALSKYFKNPNAIALPQWRLFVAIASVAVLYFLLYSQS